MKIATSTFVGEAPRVAPELLPDNAAQVAENCRLLSGNLEAWLDLAARPGIVKTGFINTAYLMGGQYWLHWRESELDYDIPAVDVARGPLEGDTSEFTIFTGTDGARWTNINLATDEPPPGGVNVGEYPYVSYRLGVPAPATAPTLSLAEGEVAEDDIDVTNGGAEAGTTTGWTTVSGDFSVVNNGDIPGLNAFEGTRFFSGGTSATTEVYQAFTNVFPGQNLSVNYQQAGGGNGSTLRVSIAFFNGATEVSRVNSDDTAVTPSLTWEERSVGGVMPDSATTARIYLRFTKVGGGNNDAYIDDITLTGTDLGFYETEGDLTDWTSVTRDGNSVVSTITGDADFGSAYRIRSRRNSAGAFYRDVNFSLNPINTIEFDFVRRGVSDVFFKAVLGADISGNGPCISFNPTNVTQNDNISWTGDSSVLGVISTDDTLGDEDTLVRCRIVATRTISSAYSVQVTLYTLPSLTEVFSETVSISVTGDYFGFKAQHGGDISTDARIDNVRFVAESAGTTSEEDRVLTNYVYTYVNSIGQESAPSPVSRDVLIGPDTTVTVTTETTGAAAYNVTDKRIYRAVTGTDGTTVYRLVAEISLATATYDDSDDDDQLEDDILITTDWDLPPFDAQNVISLPNGITLMTAKNVVCPSVVNYPHAYPELYRLLTESEIVAVGAIDTSVVLATATRPYMLLGSNPESMSMSKFEQAQGCVSKRSLASIRNYGIIYASPDGLVGISGAGNLQMLTEGYFTRREWQELAPASIKAIAHDDRYFGSCNGQDSTGRGFIFDPRAGGNGWTWLDFDWQAAYSDPETDDLYFVIDNDLWLWEGSDNKRPYTWRSKLHLLERPASFRMGQVEAADYDNLVLKLYSNGNLYYTRTVTSDREFILPAKAVRNFEYELSGTSRVRMVQMAESVEELT